MLDEFTLDKEFETLREVQEGREDEVFNKPNVVGVALGHKITKESDTGDPCMTVFVSSKLEKSLLGSGEKVPATMDKFKTDVVETGDFFAGASAPPVSAAAEQFLRHTPYPGGAEQGLAPTGQMAESAGLITGEALPYEDVGIQTLRSRVRPVEGGYSVGHHRITAGTMATASMAAWQPKAWAMFWAISRMRR